MQTSTGLADGCSICSMMKANIYCMYCSHRYTNCLIFKLSSALLIQGKTFFCSNKSGSLQRGPDFKGVARAYQAVTQKQLSEVEPQCNLLHVVLCILRSTSALCLAIVISSCGFPISACDSWADTYSYLWLLTLSLTFWFLILAMNIQLLSQFWTWALTFGLNSPCSSL